VLWFVNVGSIAAKTREKVRIPAFYAVICRPGMQWASFFFEAAGSLRRDKGIQQTLIEASDSQTHRNHQFIQRAESDPLKIRFQDRYKYDASPTMI
jgi:hypothetical protein